MGLGPFSTTAAIQIESPPSRELDFSGQYISETLTAHSGPPVQGTGVGCALNAFNATGAYLTDKIPGFQFNCAVMQAGGSDACPIDSFGHFKQ